MRRHLRHKQVDLRAVLFDLGGTLVKTASPPEIIRRILARHGVERRIEDIALAHERAEVSLAPEDYRLPYYDFWIKWNRKILEALKVHENTDFLARVLVDEWWDNADVELYPDAREALKLLKEKELKIGIITNAFEKDVEYILMRTDLPNFFDVVVGIDTVGKPKPASEIFLYALKMLNVQPCEAIFVGDDLEKDYFGALKAGLRAVLIDRNSTLDDLRLLKIKDLRELLGFTDPEE